MTPKKAVRRARRRKKSPLDYPVHLTDPALSEGLLSLHAASDLNALWAAIIELLDSALAPHHLIAALPFAGLAPIAMKTTLPVDDLEAFWMRLVSVEPPLAKAIATSPGIRVVTLEEMMTDEELLQSRFYHEIMLPYGSRHTMGMLFWERGHFTAHIGFVRTAEEGACTPEEKALLLELHPHFQVALHRVATAERERAVALMLREALEHPLTGLVLLDSSDRMVFHNRSAMSACFRWTGRREAAALKSDRSTRFDLPPQLAGGARDLMRSFLGSLNRTGIRGATLEKEIAHPSQPGLGAKLKVVVSSQNAVPPHLRIEFSQVSVPDAAVPVYRLSEAEHRVALFVARGMRNEEVAKELGLSVNTVRAHLRQVFDKLNVGHRGELSRKLNH